MNYGAMGRVLVGSLAMLTLAACGGADDDESGSATAFATVPTAVSFTGTALGDPTLCGGGTSQIIVVGGVAPYSVKTTFPDNIKLSTGTVGDKGGSVTITVLPGACLDPGSVVVTDALGKVVTVSVTSKLTSS